LLVENLSRASGNLSGYGPPEGAIELRSAIARHVSANRAIPAEPDQVFITAGAQEGFNLISRLFVQPGVRIAVEDPCYAGAAHVFMSYGGALVPVPVDGHGLCHPLPPVPDRRHPVARPPARAAGLGAQQRRLCGGRRL
jgi:GntR family transcriptional regulator/MocR family aminotransferase